ncbi:MAG: hypothetical protein PHS49_05530 [Candidatus Gracilibacteria bacterium]|nr:hypothetical protein [Candidatus Gracilibacteria bacterium]
MLKIDIDKIISNLIDSIIGNVELYLPKIIGALIVLGIGALISIWIYKFVMYLFKKFKIMELIDKLNIDFIDNSDDEEKEKIVVVQKKKKKFSDKIKINEITSKAISYYVFLIFFRLSIIVIGIKEVELFLGELITYLPSLFVAVIIGFFGVRFANFIYDVVFHALDFSKQKTAKIIASGSKVIILFFTLMAVLSKIGIATEITYTILIGFVSMLALAGGLAFGLGGKDIAAEILESFKK